MDWWRTRRRAGISQHRPPLPDRGSSTGGRTEEPQLVGRPSASAASRPRVGGGAVRREAVAHRTQIPLRLGQPRIGWYPALIAHAIRHIAEVVIRSPRLHRGGPGLLDPPRTVPMIGRRLAAPREATLHAVQGGIEGCSDRPLARRHKKEAGSAPW